MIIKDRDDCGNPRIRYTNTYYNLMILGTPKQLRLPNVF